MSIWMAAAVPLLVWTCVLWWFSRSTGTRGSVVVAAVLGGAVFAAWPASQINQAIYDFTTQLAGDARARAFLPWLVMPMVEELAKATVIGGLLMALRTKISRARIGTDIVIGAAVGLGFTAAENLQYLTLAAIQGGAVGLRHATYVRAVLGGVHHATFAATCAAGFGYARHAGTRTRAILSAGAGLMLAIVQHVLWNRFGAGVLIDRLCGAPQPEAACVVSPDYTVLFFVAPLICMIFVVPGCIALYVVAQRFPPIQERARPQ